MRPDGNLDTCPNHRPPNPEKYQNAITSRSFGMGTEEHFGNVCGQYAGYVTLSQVKDPF